jgi:hypothetical protein
MRKDSGIRWRPNPDRIAGGNPLLDAVAVYILTAVGPRAPASIYFPSRSVDVVQYPATMAGPRGDRLLRDQSSKD